MRRRNPFEIRDDDVSTLARALHLEERWQAAIFPSSAAQFSHFRRLVRFGMLDETGEWGRDIDGKVERDVRLFRLTPQGRKWIRAHEAALETS